MTNSKGEIDKTTVITGERVTHVLHTARPGWPKISKDIQDLMGEVRLSNLNCAFRIWSFHYQIYLNNDNKPELFSNAQRKRTKRTGQKWSVTRKVNDGKSMSQGKKRANEIQISTWHLLR